MVVQDRGHTVLQPTLSFFLASLGRTIGQATIILRNHWPLRLVTVLVQRELKLLKIVSHSLRVNAALASKLYEYVFSAGNKRNENCDTRCFSLWRRVTARVGTG